MASPTWIVGGSTPNSNDGYWLILQKILGATIDGGGGGGGSNNISGAGSPVGVVTPDANNQFYRDTSNNSLWQSTGLTNTSWIQWI